MTTQQRAVDVVMERVPLASRWASARWQPAAVSIGTVQSPRPGATLERCDASGEQWRFRGFEIELDRSEAEGYWLNMTTSIPRVFVMWRMSEDGATPAAHPVIVTVSYNEAARFMDGGEQVDNVPMIPEIAEWVQAFVAANYNPEPRRKVKRNAPFAGDGTDRGGRGDPRQ